MLTIAGGAASGAILPGLTGDGQNPAGIVIAGDEQVAGSLNVGDLSNTPDPGYPLQLGAGGNTFYVTAAGTAHALLSVNAPTIAATGGASSFSSSDASQTPLNVSGAATSAASAYLAAASNGLNQKAGFDGGANVRSDTGLGVWGHAAPATQVVLATGVAHTVDDVITLLQSYGLCKQS